MLEPYNSKKLLNLNHFKNKIFDDFKKGKLHHSVMLIGDRGIGKSTLGYHLANKILDFESEFKKQEKSSFLFDDIVEQNDDLSDDNSTFNLIKNKKHPDLLVVEKEVDLKTSKTDKEIKVSSSRKINDFINLAPFTSKNKVILIDSVDEMNISAQNAILKVLEEPVKNTYIFLICHNKNNILDTIASRCIEIYIPSYNYEEWKNVMSYIHSSEIKNLNTEKLKELYEISNSSIVFAKDILEQEGLFLYNHIENIFSDKILNIENIHSLADKLNNNEKLFQIFGNFIQLFLYKALKYYFTGKENESFKMKNYNFLVKNNQKSIIDKLNFAKNLIRDLEIFTLNKKHVVVVLINKIFEY